MLTIFLQSATSSCEFEIDSKITNDEDCRVRNASKRSISYQNKGEYIFWFGGKKRKYTSKPEITA